MISAYIPTPLSTTRASMEASHYLPRRPFTFSPLVLFNDFASLPPTTGSYNDRDVTKAAGPKPEDMLMDLDAECDGVREEDVTVDDNDTINPTTLKHTSALHAHRPSRPPSPSSSPSPLNEHHGKQTSNGGNNGQSMDILGSKSQPATVVTAAIDAMTPPSSYASTSSSMDALTQTLALAPDNSKGNDSSNQRQRIQVQRKKVQHMLEQNSLLWWELVRYTRMVERNQRERYFKMEDRRRRRAVAQDASYTGRSQTTEQSIGFKEAVQGRVRSGVGANNSSLPSQDRRRSMLTSGATISHSEGMEMSPSPAHCPTEITSYPTRSPPPPSPMILARPHPSYHARVGSSPPQPPVPRRPHSHNKHSELREYRPSSIPTESLDSTRYYSEDEGARSSYSTVDRYDTALRRSGSEEYGASKEYPHSYTTNIPIAETQYPAPPAPKGNVDRYSPSSRPTVEDTTPTSHHHHYHPSSAVHSEYSLRRQSPYGETPIAATKQEPRSLLQHPSQYSHNQDESGRALPHLSQSPRSRIHPSPPPSHHSGGSRHPRDERSPHYHVHEHDMHGRHQQMYHSPMPQQATHHQQQQQQRQSQSPPQHQLGAQNQQQGPGGRKRRGNLPKTVTTVLKAWLVENAKHPYPTEDEKIKLSQETGLTLNQISNWFINARRRILQPILVEAAAAAVAGTDEPMDQVTIVRKGKGSRMLVEVEGGHHHHHQQPQQQQDQQQQHQQQQQQLQQQPVHYHHHISHPHHHHSASEQQQQQQTYPRTRSQEPQHHGSGPVGERRLLAETSRVDERVQA